MKKLNNELWEDCFGNKHVVDSYIYDSLNYIGSWVTYGNKFSGYLEGIFYDSYDFYYGISDLNGVIHYYTCSDEIELT